LRGNYKKDSYYNYLFLFGKYNKSYN